MLVLSRRLNQSIIIADGAIRITVVSLRGDHVRIGVSAHPSIRVDREEIHEQILRDRMGDLPAHGDY